jgi:hypothetical protein
VCERDTHTSHTKGDSEQSVLGVAEAASGESIARGHVMSHLAHLPYSRVPHVKCMRVIMK